MSATVQGVGCLPSCRGGGGADVSLPSQLLCYHVPSFLQPRAQQLAGSSLTLFYTCMFIVVYTSQIYFLTLPQATPTSFIPGCGCGQRAPRLRSRDHELCSSVHRRDFTLGMLDVAGYSLPDVATALLLLLVATAAGALLFVSRPV